jgi:hypothetical protein
MQSQSKLRIAYYKKCGYKIKDGTNAGSDDEGEFANIKSKKVEYAMIDDD